MTDEDDALLAAFLDGELDDAAAAAFEARLNHEPDLATRAERWLAMDRTVARGLAPLADSPIPPELLRSMGLASKQTPAAAPSPLQAANDNPWWRRGALPWAGALAAGLAGILLLGPRLADTPASAPQPDLAFALETAPSLQAVRLADGTSVTPTLTVRAADGRYCREFATPRATGLACRGTAGGWVVEATGSAARPADKDRIAVAAGAADAGLDAAYRRLGASDPLDAAAEARLLRGNWAVR